MVRLNPERLSAYRISPEEAIAAVNRATTVMPSGNVRTGEPDPHRLHQRGARRRTSRSCCDTPVRTGSGPTVYLRDIGVVENGTDIITGYAHVNGRRTVYIPVTKRADASTLAVIRQRARARCRTCRNVVPQDVEIRLEFDQSKYVVNAIREPGRRRAARGRCSPD